MRRDKRITLSIVCKTDSAVIFSECFTLIFARRVAVRFVVHAIPSIVGSAFARQANFIGIKCLPINAAFSFVFAHNKLYNNIILVQKSVVCH